MLDTIVVGVDGREGGRDALALAGLLQRAFGSELVAALAYPYDPVPSRAASRDFDRAIAADAAEALNQEVTASGLKARPVIVPDNAPARALHRLAEREQAELIVVGADHHGPVGHVLAGDVAAGALHGAPCAVAVAPHGFASAAPDMGTVGVGYDGSPESRAALGWAERLALAIGATVHVLCAAEVPQGFSPSISYGINWVALAPDRLEYAEGLVAEAVAELGNGATGEAVAGVARDELVRLSEQVDLLVLGSRGYGPLRRALLGGSADRVVHGAACPVVVVPRGAHEEHAAEHAARAELAAG